MKEEKSDLFLVHSIKRLSVFIAFVIAFLVFVIARLYILMVFDSEKYGEMAILTQERERSIKAKRGVIYDRNGVCLASNEPVCSISVIHNQITDPEEVIRVLSDKLNMDEAEIRKKVSKVSSREKIKSNVNKEIGDEIRKLGLDGVMVDDDYKRYYPYGTLASKVIGFTGGDNQGIVGIEVEYDQVLAGIDGSINTLTDAKGLEIKNKAKTRVEPIPGNNLVLTIDANIQTYIEEKAVEILNKKSAKRVCIIVMNPQNGEIYGLTDVPEYDLNNPFELNYELDEPVTDKEKQDLLNQMWRCFPICDTYEPGSAFKIVTATAALEEDVVKIEDGFYCPGYRVVEDRRIRCHKVAGHGAETFKEGIMNSCNPVFMDVGLALGKERFYKHLEMLGLFETTGVDLPGEANSIFHKLENVKTVDMAVMSFGQSFQITPMQLMRAAAAVVNGGKLITPHFGLYVTDVNNNIIEKLEYPETEGAVSEETSEEMKYLLNAVVAEGTGNKAYVSGFDIGGKTATSQKLPRGNGKYIASFIGFAPSDNPQVMVLVLIDEPEGVYYGGTIAAPVAGEVFKNILPYLGIQKQSVEDNDESVDEVWIDTVF